MSTEIEKFDPSKLMQGVRDRIKSTFVSLIPDAQWEEMVKKEIDCFFKKNDGYSSREYKSDFDRIVRDELDTVARGKVKDFLKEYESQEWKDGQLKLGGNLKKILEENASTIFAAALGGIMQSTINNMRSN